MKKTILYGLALAALLILAACDSGGSFRMINRTSYPLYVSVNNEDEVVIPGGEEHTWPVDTDKQHIFNPNVEKRIPVHVIGETYNIYDETEQSYTDSTTVRIRVGETTNAYIDPNRASIKLVNDSSQAVDNALIYKHNFVAPIFVANLDRIEAGQFKFLRADYATAGNNFYYYATVQMEDGTTYNFGDETTILLVDQQFLITLSDPQ